ncbi:sigma-70 family RNA polymerase sigma factor [Streptomyces sp. NPDC006435]|uniref:sigma-70 family RNA polymerase sigma factor n=1 Tax=Streptomyces sp. NPDC006435 TaxID=3154300 RepID=UPI0033B5BF2E
MPITSEKFETARPRLLSVAHRMLGSAHDAEDAVQAAWVRAATARSGPEIENPAAWLTTVTARICLDELRARHRRKEAPLLADAIPAEQLAVDEEMLRKEDVSRALMVLLNRLTPPQRIAYVLHDLFAVPFDRIAPVLGVTVPGAKKHASRARRRLALPQESPARTDGPERAGAPIPTDRPDQEIVEAFLTAARTGDTRTMLRLLAPDSVRDADAALLPLGGRTVVTGADAIAAETVRFRHRIEAACRMVVDGRPVHLIAPGGHPFATIDIATADRKVTRITLRPVRADARFAPAVPATTA